VNIVMRKLCCLLIGFIAICAPNSPLDAADKVRISVTNPNMSFLPSGVAFKKGFFKDEGLDVEIIRMNVPNIITALVTGDVAYTLLFGSVVRGALRGMPCVLSRASWMVQLTPWSPSLNTNRASNLREKLSASVTSAAPTRWLVE